MSGFKANLFKLLGAAQNVYIEGYEVDSYSHPREKPDLLHCECGDDVDWYFADQNVKVVDGECFAQAANWIGQPFTVHISAYVTRPIEEGDLK